MITVVLWLLGASVWLLVVAFAYFNGWPTGLAQHRDETQNDRNSD